MMEQERLLIEAAQKDPRRFAELYETNNERVYAVIVRRVQDQTDAEDLTSEVFQHAMANLSRFEWRGVPFAVWLYRIAANTIADRGRRLSKHNADSVSDDDLDQSSWLEIERRAALFQLVDSLPEDQRSAINHLLPSGRRRQVHRVSQGGIKRRGIAAVRLAGG